MKSREIVFDLAKALVMLCVVHGHLLGHGIVLGAGPSFVGNLYVLAGMPLFFMISGFFAARHIDDRIGYFLSSAVTLIWPLFSFGICFAIIETTFGIPTFDGWKEVFFPIYRISSGGWFLRTLANLFIILGFLACLPRRWRPVTFCAIYACMFFCGNVHGMWAGFIVNMGPYFGFGVFVLSCRPLYRNNYAGIVCGLVYLISAAISGDITTNGLSWYHATSNWHIFCDWDKTAMFGSRLVLGMSGSIFILWMLNNLCKIKSVTALLHFIASFGTTTLGVYVMHEWPLVFLRKGFNLDPLPSWSSWLAACFVLIALHYATKAILSCQALRMFFFMGKDNARSIVAGITSMAKHLVSRRPALDAGQQK